jgi:aromatic ring-opening dioxygenase catalytic subunit (LigB family)
MEMDIDAARMNGGELRCHKSLLSKRIRRSLSITGTRLPHSGMAVPTPDHYLPMLYTLGMMGEDDPLVFTHEGIQYASVSMLCFRVG